MTTSLCYQIRKTYTMIPKLNDKQIEILMQKVVRTYVSNLKPFPTLKNQRRQLLLIEIIKN